MILTQLNYWAVIVATVVYFALGWLWFSALFGKVWMKGHNVTMPQDEEGKAKMKKEMPKFMLTSVVCSFLIAVALSVLIERMGLHGWMSGVKLGIVAAAFPALAIGMSHLYTRKSFTTFLIDAGYPVVGIIVMGVILGMW